MLLPLGYCVYWTYIIVRIAYRSVVGGKTDDDREDKRAERVTEK
jgi:hypothetical protein